MNIEFSCLSCGKNYSVSEDLAGKSAKCKCGAKIQIPESLSNEIRSLDDLFDDIPEVTKSSLGKSTKTTPHGEKNNEAIHKTVASLTGNRGLYGLGKVFEGNGLAIGKIAAGAVVGGILGLKAINRSGNQTPIDPNWRIPIVIGTALIGAAVASLLLVADAVRNSKQNGRRVPAILRWYFANGWLSLILWSITVFVGVIAVLVISLS